MAETPSPAVEMRRITKRFPGGIVAVDDVSLTVARGEIHALIGENGAGKSTLMSVLAGLHEPEAGEIVINGVRVEHLDSASASRLGIGMVHQHFMLIPVFTVAENVVLGMEPTSGLRFDRHAAEEKVRALSDQYGLKVDPTARVESLSVGQEQRVEILKVLHRGADILILDEPTAVLTPQETKDLFSILLQLKSRGKTIIFISHKLNEVMTIADRITVLRGGKWVGTLGVKEATKESLARMMVGRNVIFAGEVPQGWWCFEDILLMDDDHVKILLAELRVRAEAGWATKDDVALALKVASEELKQKFFRNMSPEEAGLIREKIESMGPVRLASVEGAQFEIEHTLRQLEEEGKVLLPRAAAGDPSRRPGPGRLADMIAKEKEWECEIARIPGADSILATSVSTVRAGDVVLEVERLEAVRANGLPALRGVWFQVRSGEILGIAGVEGNGQTELLEVLVGIRPATAGRIEMHDGTALKEVTAASVAERFRLGLAHIPEDRHKRGLVLEFTVAENAVLGRQREEEYAGATGLRFRAIDKAATTQITRFDIRPPERDVLAGVLSGGNQQKVVVARELARKPRVLIAAQPTRGVDVGAIEIIHCHLDATRASGTGVLLVSSDLSELLALSDRIAVLHEGTIVATLDPSKTSEEELGLYMSGAKSPEGAR